MTFVLLNTPHPRTPLGHGVAFGHVDRFAGHTCFQCPDRRPRDDANVPSWSAPMKATNAWWAARHAFASSSRLG